ncbi:Uncharacterized protein HDE_05241 [Halotydeus destructor]|nr:Uncharacterized protein HDE_05241 [Halotydeus destructor]
MMVDDNNKDARQFKSTQSNAHSKPVACNDRVTELEMSLQQTKRQSSKIRQALLDKIVQLERRASEAEAKKTELESELDKVKEESMSHRFSNSQRSSSCPSPQLVKLQTEVEEKEKMISQLESEIEEQKKLRLLDAKQVEEKAAKIKEWVATKLKELEDQNQTLKEENKKYNDKLSFLEKRLVGSSPETRRRIESQITTLKESKRLPSSSTFTSVSSHSIVDPRRKAKALGSRSPKRFPRKDFVPMSSSSDDDDNHDGIFRNKSSPSTRKPIPPPRSRPNQAGVAYANIPGTPQLSKRRLPSEVKESRGGSLDRKLADMKKLNFGEIREKRKQAIAAAAEEYHDYADIYSPSTVEAKPFDCGITKPPTPPLHRCPSWESRIYKVASSSIHSAMATPTHSIKSNFKQADARNSFSLIVDKETVRQSHVFEPNIPVYATVQGKASQIRSAPFSGESSDSSDNETDGRVTTTTTSSSVSGDRSSHEVYATPLRSRVRRGISVESGLSDDYDIPPDAVPSSMARNLLLANDEPRTPRRFSSLRREAPSHFRQNALEKSGYLTKLGGKIKTWNKRWFVLKAGNLYYYKNQSDVIRQKLRGQIKLDENCRVTNNVSSTNFHISVMTKKKEKVYYLAAESREDQVSWCRILSDAVRRQSSGFASCLNAKPTVEGWLTKVKHGHPKKVWCVLVSKNFLYFKSPSEINPLGCINMRNMKVEEVVGSDSDNDEPQNSDTESCHRDSVEPQSNKTKFTIVLISKYDGTPVYLLVPNKTDFDAWLYHMTVVSCGDITGTPFEHAVSRLMQSDSPQSEVANIDHNPVWSDPVLCHTKDNIVQSLTTLPTEELRKEAVQLYKSIQLFMSVPLDSAGIDYHVALVQNSLELCLDRPELQNEIYSQLIKQTSGSASKNLCSASSASNFFLCATQSIFTCEASANEKTSPTGNVTYLPNPLSSVTTSAKTMLEKTKKIPDFVLIQGFQLLALTIPLFLPTGRTMWLLKQHLRRKSVTKTDAGQYSAYCQRALERASEAGLRKYRPSRMEVLGILLRNPYQHSLPHSIPVHLMNDTYLVVGFDGSSTVRHFVNLLNNQAGIRECGKSGFCLFSDDPIDKNAEHLLEDDTKLADIISRWEIALRERRLGKFENTKVVRLYYKNRLYMKDHLRDATEKEKLFLTYQVNHEVLGGRFPTTPELALEFCALLSQIEFGNLSNFDSDEIIRKSIRKFYPQHLLEMVSYSKVLLGLRSRWSELQNCTTSGCVRIYLNCAKKWSLFGAQLFHAIVRKPIKMKSSSYKTTLVANATRVWLAVTNEAISILDEDTMNVVFQYPYRCVVTFGGCKDDFMLVINNRAVSEIDSGSASGGASSASDNSVRHDKLLFSMEKNDVLHITLLVADYINNQPTLIKDSNV